MGSLDELMNELRSEGAVDSQGSFTLDREQARAKMQKFQLADVRRYVLELVQAAVLRGAETIEFEIDADDMRLRFGGAPFEAAEIDDLYGSLFSDARGPRVDAVRQLALALNAAMGMEPRHIHLRSGSVALRMRPGSLDEIETLDTPAAQTEIHVRQRLRPRVLVDFFRNLGKGLAEEIYLRERCRYATIPVVLDGKEVNAGLEEPSLATVAFVGPGFRGAIAVLQRGQPAELRLIKDGVWIDTRELPECGSHLLITVACSALRKDVSQARIVEDETLERILAAIRRERWRAWRAALDGGQGDRSTLRELIYRQILGSSNLDEVASSPDALVLAETIEWLDARGAGAEAMSLRDVMRLKRGEDPVAPHASPTISLARIIERAQQDKALRWAMKRYPELSPNEEPVLFFDRAGEHATLGTFLGKKLSRVDSLLRLEQRRLLGRRQWRARPMEARLPEYLSFALRAPIDDGPVRGEVGLEATLLTTPRFGEPTSVRLIKDGCLLTKLDPELGLPHVTLVIEAPFEPNDDHDEALLDATYISALLAALRALIGPMGELAAKTRDHVHADFFRGLIKRWLVAMVDPDSAQDLLAGLGATTADFELVVPPELRRQAPGDAHPLVGAPLFADTNGERVSIATLAERARELGRIEYLPDYPTDKRLGCSGVAMLGRDDRRIVAALFGPDALVEHDLEPRQRELAFRDSAPIDFLSRYESLKIDLRSAGVDPFLWSTLIPDQHSGGGVLGLAYGPAVNLIRMIGEPPPATIGIEELELDGDSLDGAQVLLLIEGRPITTLTLELGLGPLVGLVEHPGLQPDASWSGVVEDEAYAEILLGLRGAVAHLFEELCTELERQPPGAREWLARVLLHAAAVGRQRGDSSKLERVRELPLLDTIDGQHISLATAAQLLAEHGELEAVDREVPEAPVTDPPVLRAGEIDRIDIGALLGTTLGDGQARVNLSRAVEALETLPPVDEARLPQDQVFGVLEIHDKHSRGEVGLSRRRSSSGLRMQLCTAGRLVGELEDPHVPVAMDAILIDDNLPFDDQGEVDRKSRRVRNHLRRARRKRPELILALCAQFDQLDGELRRHAWRVLLAHAVSEHEQDRRPIRDEAYAAVMQLPGLVDLWGKRYSLSQLRRRRHQGGIAALIQRRPSAAELAQATALAGRRIFALDREQVEALSTFVPVTLFDEDWARELTLAQQLADAPRVDIDDLSRTALVERKAQVAGRLEALLWIPAEFDLAEDPTQLPEIIYARDGLELAREVLHPTLPCAGVVSGVGLAFNQDGVELDARQRASLERQVLIMYLDLAGKFAKTTKSSTAHERAVAFLAHAKARLVEGGELPGDQKRGRALRERLDELAPPSLVSSFVQRFAGPERDVESEPPTRPEDEGTPEPAPAPAPAPAAPPPVDPETEAEAPTQVPLPADPEDRLIAALHSELIWARQRHDKLLGDLRLSNIELGETPGGAIVSTTVQGIVLHRKHPLVTRLLGQPEPDPVDLCFLVAAVYSLMNRLAEEITDDHEREFVAVVAEAQALAQRSRAAGEPRAEHDDPR